MKLTKKEIRILYTLLNSHLNTIGEVGTYLNPTNKASVGDYLWKMETLEKKLENNL